MNLQPTTYNLQPTKQGVSIYLALVIMFILLSIGLGVSLIIVSQMKMIRGMGDSVAALYAADTGIDKTIFYDNKVIPPLGTRGLCYMNTSCSAPDCDWTCSGCGESGADCGDTTCTDCTIIYESVFNGKKYRVEADAMGMMTTIKSVGSYKDTKRAIKVERTVPPVAAMKTQVNGYFYVPDPAYLVVHSLKVVFLFDDLNLEGDQTGGTGEYPHVPNGIVEGGPGEVDLILISGAWGSEGDPDWEYMADVVPDRVVGVIDLSLVSMNDGNTGTYITDFNPANVTIEFKDAGGGIIGTPSLDSRNMVGIPSGAVSFTVLRNSIPIGAYILFYP